MTREEAIKWIRTISVNYLTMSKDYTTADDVQADKKRAEALSMAVEVLQAEPVVRCKDCKHWNEEDHWCNIRDSYGWDYTPDDYCSYGERREP